MSKEGILVELPKLTPEERQGITQRTALAFLC
jgi:hypothetical protein